MYKRQQLDAIESNVKRALSVIKVWPSRFAGAEAATQLPEGSTVAFELRLEAVMEGVLVTGQADAELTGECVRCLEDIHDRVVADFQELFVYEESDTAQSPHGGEDDDVSRLEGDLLDLEPVLRDAVVLTLPFQPLCRDDCPGLCTECGARLADDPGHQHDEPIDPRWATLRALTQDPASSRLTED